MKLIVAVALILALAGCSKSIDAITDAEIRRILAVNSKAANAKDVATIVNCLADDLSVDMTVQGPRGSQRLTMTKDQYRTAAEQSYAATTSYSYEQRSPKITIAPDKKSATVVSDIVEIMTIGGTKINSLSKETATFQIRNGRVMVTKLVGNTQLR